MSRDQQRSKVYKWEQTFEPNSSETDRLITLKECSAIIKKATAHYKLKMPRIADGRGCRRALYSNWKYTITLPCWARSPEVSLHETAHLVTKCLFHGAPSHGREFVAVFMYLLSKFAGYNLRELARSANEHGVDFASAAACKPPRRKK